MRSRHFALVALVLCSSLVSACKTATTTTTTVTGTPRLERAPEPVVNPVGRWSLALVAQGQAMQVTLEVSKKEDGSLGGVITSEAFPPVPITKATLEGKTLTMTFTAPTNDAGTMVLVIDGDAANGEWSMAGDGSKVTGKRI